MVQDRYRRCSREVLVYVVCVVQEMYKYTDMIEESTGVHGGGHG